MLACVRLNGGGDGGGDGVGGDDAADDDAADDDVKNDDAIDAHDHAAIIPSLHPQQTPRLIQPLRFCSSSITVVSSRTCGCDALLDAGGVQ